MTDHMLLLERAGFVLTDGEFVRTFGNAEDEHRMLLLDAQNLAPPGPETRNFTVISLRSKHIEPGEHYDIVFSSTDVRDIVAFAVADESDFLMQSEGNVPEERLLSWEYVAVSNPFSDEQYGDWLGHAITDWPTNADGRAIIVTHPLERAWKNEYIAWRDEWCDRLLQEPTVKP